MKLVNYTIDDQYGDEVTGRLVRWAAMFQDGTVHYALTWTHSYSQVDYSPPNTWSQGNDCSYCTARPDNKSAFDGTSC